MSISYLNRKHPGNEITVVCHSSPQGKVYSSPHLNQVLCASEFDLILQMVLQLGKWWRQQENPSHALPTPAASLCSGFVSKINFHGFGRGENHYRKDKNNVFDFFFFLVYVIVFYPPPPPRRLMFKMNNGLWGGGGRGAERFFLLALLSAHAVWRCCCFLVPLLLLQPAVLFAPGWWTQNRIQPCCCPPLLP